MDPESESESISADGIRVGFRSGSVTGGETRFRIRRRNPIRIPQADAPHGRLRWQRTTVTTTSPSPPPQAPIHDSGGMEVEENAHMSTSEQTVAPRVPVGQVGECSVQIRGESARASSQQEHQLQKCAQISGLSAPRPRPARCTEEQFVPVLSRALCPTPRASKSE